MRALSLHFIFIIFLLVNVGYQIHAQLAINSSATNYTINFDQTVDGVNNGVFAGSGFTTSPNEGQLDSDGWRAFGSNNMGTFGGTHTSGAFTRGTSPGGVTNGNPNSGIYSFDRDNSGAVNRAFGIQHFAGGGGNVFTPGYFTLRIQNTTGSTIQDLSISYNIFVFNDKSGSSTFNFSHSSHGNQSMSWTNESSLNYTSPGPSSGASWSAATNRSIILENVNIPDNAYYYVRWTINDASGNNSPRDEIALDDIVVNAVEILPVQWLSFSVKKRNDQSLLEWKTSSEVNNDHFLVEHSLDGSKWDMIGQVDAKGSSNMATDYGFVHTNPSPGINYYRIVQVDVDGTKTFSEIRHILHNRSGINTVNIYPNPVRSNEQIIIQSTEEIRSYCLFNDAGQIVQKGEVQDQHIRLQNLTGGSYFIQLSTTEGRNVKRVIVVDQ